MKILTKEQAIQMSQSKWWVDMSPKAIAMFQLHEPLLCMPFDIFHENLEKALGRGVFTHEFALNLEGLRSELRDGAPAPTIEEILRLIPEEKRILIGDL